MGHPSEVRTGRRSRRYPLEQGPGAPARCRDLTRDALRDWFGLTGPDHPVLVGDILLLVSEVVTNAYRHGGAPYELELVEGRGRIWVQVTDAGSACPRPGRHRAARASGHGLYLLQRLSADWGWARHGSGKSVWFAVDVRG
ncbi:ATP-binding protein [Streptomyces genisteinicus]|uniref:ATP-binding protein n=1 Tax=Streptomyces genisteinicus TaxID=2768068 RepID=A0A7H0HMY3_9ACTN|nr:ATP-binding protein [Streptomyces genisteinicus]QNP61899.1 ATP-binding protein [Streptomyces genisteinicus]